MSKRVFLSLLFTIISANLAFACYPDPEFSYDDISSQDISISTTTVNSIEFESFATHSCWRIRYLNAKYLYGFGEKEFSVKTCSGEVFQVDAFSEELEGFECLGFVPNAEVLVGLVNRRKDIYELRYAIPSC